MSKIYQKQNDYDVTVEAVEGVLQKMDQFKKDLPKKTTLLGFDGYVDSLYSLVHSRDSATEWEKMESMKEFGERVLNTAGSACNIERVLKKNLAGGFGPNTARAVSHFGANVNLIGALGYPNMHPLFLKYPDSVKSFSIKNPGTTAAYEFDDGKVMTTDFGNINDITWDLILKRVGRDKFIELVEESDAIGQGHWALVPNMTRFWEKMIEDIFPNLSNPKDKIFLVDVADMKKRDNASVNAMLQALQKVDEFMPAVLAMNDKETADIAKVMTAEDSVFSDTKVTPITSREDYIEFGKKANESLNLSYIVTHDPHFAVVTTKTDHFWVTEGYTSKPRFTTAAGDHFTGGTLLGLVCGLEPAEALVIGNALTAIFVRTGVSCGVVEVERFVQNYTSYILDDIDYFELD